jgi:hypothetical protein
VADIGAMSAKESFLFADEYLRPVIEDDPLLRERYILFSTIVLTVFR